MAGVCFCHHCKKVLTRRESVAQARSDARIHMACTPYTHWGHRGYPLYEARPNHEHPKKFGRLDDAKAHVENELRKMRELKQMAYSQYNKDL